MQDPQGIRIRRRADQPASAPDEASTETVETTEEGATEAAQAAEEVAATAAPRARFATIEHGDRPAAPRPAAEAVAAAPAPPAAAPAPAPAPQAPATPAAPVKQAAPAAPAPRNVEPPRGRIAEAPARAMSQREEAMPTTDDFAALLGDMKMESPSFRPGDRVSAPVVSIGGDSVFVDLGGKSEGAIAKADLLDDDGVLNVSIGQIVDAWVVETRNGIRLTTKMGSGSGSDALEQAAASGIPVEGRVGGVIKGGFEVTVLGKRAFCPLSQIDLEPVADPGVWVGQNLRFRIVRVENGGRNIVVSRAQLIRDEREAKAKETLETLEVGAIFDGTVTRVADFGAFVDIGGIDGLVHVSEIGYARYENAGEALSVGQRVRVKVLRIDDAEDTKKRRIALSMKALQDDPWVAAIARYDVGKTYVGRVAKLEKFGAFVELEPGLDGLVHISEISAGKRIGHPQEVLAVGQQVEVQILSIEPRKRQVALSIKALQADPWSRAAADMPPGTMVQGTVQKLESFGAFVELPAGIVGLLPISQLEGEEAKHVHTRFRAGTPVEARVIEVDPVRRRLTLSRRSDAEEQAKAEFEAYRASNTAAAPKQAFGTFADLLKGRR